VCAKASEKLVQEVAGHEVAISYLARLYSATPRRWWLPLGQNVFAGTVGMIIPVGGT
jgi:hypothetical protein